MSIIARFVFAVGMMALLWFAFRVGADRVIAWEDSPEGQQYIQQMNGG